MAGKCKVLRKEGGKKTKFWGGIQEMLFFTWLQLQQTFIMCLEYDRHCAKCWDWGDLEREAGNVQDIEM
jgi:hypothetical protein